MAMTNSILSSPSSLNRSIDKVCDDAQGKGELKLNSRKLKDFPAVASKYDLSDVVSADLSKNKFTELPLEVCQLLLLEQLDCYNNAIRSIPDAIIGLKCLTYLNLSRNQLTNIPIAICHLPLQVCILRNNRLVSIPEEIGSMKYLRSFDVSCNEISVVPPQVGNLSSLQLLNLKRNLLVEIPLEICQLRLLHLDVSANRISSLPTQLRLMTSLQTLVLDQNPMTFPPAVLCKRGRIHVFKFLEIQAIKEDKRGIVLETELQKSFRSPILSDVRFQNGFASGSCRKSYTFDSGYNTSDGDSRSQESQELNCTLRRFPVESPSKWEPGLNHSTRNQNNGFSPKTVDERGGEENTSIAVPESFGLQGHIQTYKEYKEALRLQRASDNVYKKSSVSDDISVSEHSSPKLCPSKAKNSVPSKNSAQNSGASSSLSEDEFREKHQTLVNQWQYDSVLAEPLPNDRPKKHSLPNIQVSSAVQKTAFVDSKSSVDGDYLNADWENGGRNNFTWPKNSCPSVKPSKSSFTMRRELDKAREEQELIAELREILESRLKLKLPEDIESALTDGVFLCHLANHVHANSVACIHVPSPAVPKLTVAKCRRNVDNFLEACRRLGVPNAELHRLEELIVKQNMARLAPAHQTSLSTKENLPPADRTLGDIILSCFLLVIFVSTVMLLYLYPPSP